MRFIRGTSLSRLLPLSCALSLLCSNSASAQGPQYEVIHAFQSAPGDARAPLLASGGKLYGLTGIGGAHGVGAVFTAQPTAGGGLDVSFLHEFDRSQGGASFAGLIEGGDGAFYGTTPAHAAHGLGSIFRITPAGAFSVLHAFSGPDGARPQASLVYASDGNFYGTTLSGGANDRGTVFRLSPAGTLTTLHSFSGDSGAPRTSLVQAGDGALYGTTNWFEGTTASRFSVFRIALDGTFATVHEFGSLESPAGPLTLGPDGDLYGVYTFIFAWPNFFKITTSGEFSVIRQSPGGIEGSPEQRLIVASDGNFYGTSPHGGEHGRGSAFKLTPGGEFSIIHHFTEAEGAAHSGLTVLDGVFFGVTANGGVANHGAVFQMTGAGSTTLMYEFGGNDGETPTHAPTLLANGTLFGTTLRGGARAVGTIYRITAGGQFSTLHSFSEVDGSLPYGRLTLADDGYLYGTTIGGGCHGRGTIFRVEPLSGTFSMVHCFAPTEGRVPFASLLQASDGKLYGTTASGGTFDQGTMFSFSLSGVLTIIHSFGSSFPYIGQYQHPMGPVVESADGNFYGTTFGLWGGSIFRMTPDGLVSTVTATPPTFSCCPLDLVAGLHFASDLTDTPSGDLYAVGYRSDGFGVLLKASRTWIWVPPILTPTPIAVPPGPVGSPPMQAADGYFYGVTSEHPGGTGSIYRIDLNGDGAVTTLKVLSESEGSAPLGRMVQGPDGRLYGTTPSGGAGGRGVVFSFRPE